MNLREKLAALLKELEGAKTKEDVDRIKGEILTVKGQIALADEKQSILDGMKSDNPVGGKGKTVARTLGEKAAAAVTAKGHRAPARASPASFRRCQGGRRYVHHAHHHRAFS